MKYGLICILVAEEFQIEVTLPHCFTDYQNAVTAEIDFFYIGKEIRCSSKNKAIACISSADWWNYRIVRQRERKDNGGGKVELTEYDYEPFKGCLKDLPLRPGRIQCVAIATATVIQKEGA